MDGHGHGHGFYSIGLVLVPFGARESALPPEVVYIKGFERFYQYMMINCERIQGFDINIENSCSYKLIYVCYTNN